MRFDANNTNDAVVGGVPITSSHHWQPSVFSCYLLATIVSSWIVASYQTRRRFVARCDRVPGQTPLPVVGNVLELPRDPNSPILFPLILSTKTNYY